MTNYIRIEFKGMDRHHPLRERLVATVMRNIDVELEPCISFDEDVKIHVEGFPHRLAIDVVNWLTLGALGTPAKIQFVTPVKHDNGLEAVAITVVA